MLDTDSVSYALRGQGQVAANIVRRRPSQLCISSITVAELRFGASRQKSAKLHELIDAFTANIVVIPFDEAAALEFGRIGADLAGRGTPIGEFDVLIAAHAVSSKAVLVTNNERHFARVRGLHVENWA
jgi:tRNA(fMet)-specific endonuclease VapC